MSKITESSGPGRKREIQQIGHIHLKVEMADKNKFVRAAQKSPQRNLTQWMLSAAREKLERDGENKKNELFCKKC